MHRFFLTAACDGEELLFPQETAHQIARVLRLRSGERVIVLDGAGGECEVELLQVGNPTSGRVIARRPAGGEPHLRLTLYLCLTQREKFEWMLQKCTEVGAAAFVPVISSRCLVQSAADVSAKGSRWQRILQEAAEQSGRGCIPALAPAVRLEAALHQVAQAGAAALIPWEGEHSLDVRTALGRMPRPLAELAVLIGPEGGFATEEVAAAARAGFQAVTLGARILRMETAAVVTTALALYELGEMGG